MAKAKAEKRTVQIKFEKNVTTSTHCFKEGSQRVETLTEADIDYLKEIGASVTDAKAKATK